MGIKERFSKLSPEAKKKAREQRKAGITSIYDSDAVYNHKNKKQIIYFTEDKITCYLYEISLKTNVDAEYQPIRPFCNETYWEGGLYYTVGSKIENYEKQTIDTCIVVINESSYSYEKIDRRVLCRGLVPSSTQFHIYLYKNGNLYLMDSPEHPKVPKHSYSFLEEICINQSHIKAFHDEMNRIIQKKGKVLIKKPIQPKNTGSK